MHASNLSGPPPQDPAPSLRLQPSPAVRRPRVLRVITRLNTGAAARQALFLTAELPARGFDTRLVWGPSGQDEGQIDPPSGLPNTYIPYLGKAFSPLDDVRAERQLAGIMRRWRPQVVHTHMTKAGALGRIAARQTRVPVIVHSFHGHLLKPPLSAPRNTAFVAMQRELAKRTDALVTTDQWVRDALLALDVGRPEQWFVIPVGVDLDLLSARPDQRTARAALGLPLEGQIVGCVGPLASAEDDRTFLAAASRVAELHPGTRFVIAGDGDVWERLEPTARELLGDRAIFLGRVRDLPSLYAACDVIALTSRLEGIPAALIEASAAGKPVVATRVGGVRELVRDGNTGWLVAPGDPRGFAANIAALLEDPVGAARMGEEGAIWVRDRFSQERSADHLTQLYCELRTRKRATRQATRVE